MAILKIYDLEECTSGDVANRRKEAITDDLWYVGKVVKVFEMLYLYRKQDG